MAFLFILLGGIGRATITIDEAITVRDFLLVTEIGEKVLHEGFDRRRLASGFDKLALTFRAADLDVSVSICACECHSK